MSSSGVTSRDSTGGLSAGAMVPFTQTWINTNGGSTVTTAATLVGQVLDNGATNWVGYDNGDAYYLLQTSAPRATQTTLANGQIYYVSEGSVPAGYLATGGLASGSGSGSAATASSTGSSTASGSSTRSSGSNSAAVSSSASGTSGSGSSGSATGSAASTTSSSSGHKLTLSATFAVACGLLAVFTL